MAGFKREESKFAPVPDGTYTIYATDAAFVISSQKLAPGVNFKFKINEIDEAGQPQVNAGRSFFMTSYLSEKSVGFFCQLLDMMGFKVDGEGEYLLADGSKMPNFFTDYKDKDPVPFLIGLPFVTKLVGKENKYKNDAGEEKENTQYNLLPNLVLPPEGAGRKIMQLSVHPSKAAMFNMNPAMQAAAGQQAPSPAAVQASFTNVKGF